MEVGLVLSCIDGVSRVVALDHTSIGELLVLTAVKAVTLNLEYIITGLSILGNDRAVEQADIAERTYAELLIQVGFFLIGRIIDPAANFLDENYNKNPT
jgi:F0F1-type ATP synthase alpha subunit